MTPLRALIAPRPNRSRWAYVPVLPALALLSVLALDESIVAALYLLLLLVVGIVQLFRPMLLGWALLLVLFVLYTGSLFHTAMSYLSNGIPIDRGRYVLLLACGGVPSATLVLARPRTEPDERGMVLLALVLAIVMIAPLFAPVL